MRFFISLLLLIGSYSLQAETHKPQQFLTAIAGKPDEGEQIIQHYCINCHAKAPLIPLGAPKIGDNADWKPRLQTSFDSLFEHTDAGVNAMPARGGCFECSDQQLFLAVLALIPKNEQKALIQKLKDSKKYNELKKRYQKS